MREQAEGTRSDIQCVVRSADVLGEVPLWCERTRKLWWVDVRRPALQSFDPASGVHTAQRLNEGMQVGAIALRERGGFLLATNSGFYVFDPADGKPPRETSPSLTQIQIEKPAPVGKPHG